MTQLKVKSDSANGKSTSRSKNPESVSRAFSLTPVDNNRLVALCGEVNSHIRSIEQMLDVRIVQRGNHFSAQGQADNASAAESVVRELYRQTRESRSLTREQVHLALVEAKSRYADRNASEAEQATATHAVVRTRKQVVRGKNVSQRLYLENILTHDITFGVGPAGTGKTYLAVARATEALLASEVSRIVLVRPVVEAGERLGFLPGDIGQKIDPYLRPLYDALYEMLGFEKVGRLMEKGVIELAPLAYMRGRTLNESFVILDEAQNTTTEQMKMFLTRLGFSSRAVITGDITQIDLPRGTQSGLRHALNVLDGVNGISISTFKPRDVVRHPLVQRIVEAYDDFEGERAGVPYAAKPTANSAIASTSQNQTNETQTRNEQSDSSSSKGIIE